MSNKELRGTHAFKMRNYFNIKLIKYYLLTENEVIIGKSQNEALMYWRVSLCWFFFQLLKI